MPRAVATMMLSTVRRNFTPSRTLPRRGGGQGGGAIQLGVYVWRAVLCVLRCMADSSFRGISYDLPKARSMLHTPDPTLAIYRKMKQNNTAGSPSFKMGQKLLG